MHDPINIGEYKSDFYKRLAYDEILASFLVNSEIRKKIKKIKKEEKKELEDVIDEFLQNDDSKTPPTESQDYKTSTLKELNQLLEGAVKNEDYEIAAKIRDEISKRD